jgi:hypothetical protein
VESLISAWWAGAGRRDPMPEVPDDIRSGYDAPFIADERFREEFST